MTINFINFTKSLITADINSTTTRIILSKNDYAKFLDNTGDEIYAVLAGSTGFEIVKVTISESNVTQGLKVTRGQEGSTAQAWLKGSIIYQELTETFLNQVLQKAVNRIIDYVPDGVLSPAYANEVVIDTDNDRVWKSVGLTTEWRLIGGVMQVATPEFSPAAGSYGNGQEVTITSATPGAVIYYTIDGTDVEVP